MASLMRRALGVLTAGVVCVAACGGARAQTFVSTGAISVPGVGAGTPYGSAISVSGGPTSMVAAGILVTLDGISSARASDLDVLLVSPNGEAVMLMSDVGATGPFSGSLRFRSVGTVPAIGEALVSGGVYQPTDYDAETMTAPAPAGPYTRTFADWAGDNANGVWLLYVLDDSGVNSGGHTIGSWSLTFGTQAVSSTPSSVVRYQGRLKVGSSTGATSADFRVSLWTSSASTSLLSLVAGPSTLASVPVDADGLFTLDLPFDAVAFRSSSQLFLEIEVRSPAGSGSFVTLTPRQPLGASPYAVTARRLVGGPVAGVSTAEVLTDGTLAVNGRLRMSEGTSLEFMDGGARSYQIGRQLDSFTLARVTRSETSASILPIAVIDSNDMVDVRLGLRVGDAGAGAPALLVNDRDVVALTAGAGSLAVGDETGTNLLLDSTAVQARQTSNTATTLNLNPLGGNIRMVGTSVSLVGIARTPTANRLEVNGDASKTTAGTWLANSDARIKREVRPVTNALATLARVRPVTFRYTDTYVASHAGVEASRRYYNVLAQEFATVFPESVKGSGEYLPGMEGVPAGEVLQVDTHPALMTSIAAVNELHAMVLRQQEVIARLAEQNARLEARLRALEAGGGGGGAGGSSGGAGR